MWVTNHDVDTWRSEEHQNYCTIKNIYNRGSSMNSYYWKDSQTHAQTINRAPSNPSKTKRHIYQFLWNRNQPPSAHQPSFPPVPVTSSIAAGRVIKGLAATALWKHLGLAASDEGLWQQQPAGCDAAMSGVALVHIGLVSLEMLVGSVSKDIGLEYCFGMLW